MEKHFCGHLAYFFTFEFDLPDQPTPPRKIKRNTSQSIIHRQHKSVSFDSFLVTKGCQKRFPQGKSSIFDGMMFIDIQIVPPGDLDDESRRLLRELSQRNPQTGLRS